VSIFYDLLKKETWLLALGTKCMQPDPDPHFSFGSGLRRQILPDPCGSGCETLARRRANEGVFWRRKKVE
jgi:hypothetical protein